MRVDPTYYAGSTLHFLGEDPTYYACRPYILCGVDPTFFGGTGEAGHDPNPVPNPKPEKPGAQTLNPTLNRRSRARYACPQPHWRIYSWVDPTYFVGGPFILCGIYPTYFVGRPYIFCGVTLHMLWVDPTFLPGHKLTGVSTVGLTVHVLWVDPTYIVGRPYIFCGSTLHFFVGGPYIPVHKLTCVSSAGWTTYFEGGPYIYCGSTLHILWGYPTYFVGLPYIFCGWTLHFFVGRPYIFCGVTLHFFGKISLYIQTSEHDPKP
jgi:hypothetical protein